MKQLTDYIKKHFITIIVGFIVCFALGYVLVRYMQSQYEDPITSLVSEKVVEFKDNLKKDNARVETNKSTAISGIPREQYEELLRRYNDKSIEFNSFTNISGVLSESLKIVKLDRDNLKNKVWEWENRKPSGSVIKATMNEKDSVLYTSVDVKLNVTDVKDKGGLFKKDKYYTDIYSPDQNIKINGVQNFRREITVKRKRLGLGFQAGYGFTSDLKATPYIGIGISYNLINL